LNSGSRHSAIELLHQPISVLGIFRDRVLWTIFLGWLQTMILLISVFLVARITGHQCPANIRNLDLHAKDILNVSSFLSLDRSSIQPVPWSWNKYLSSNTLSALWFYRWQIITYHIWFL
jgi:hypothetical protein